MSEAGTVTAMKMIALADIRLIEAAAELSELDAVAGDGDHGVNVTAAFADAQSRIAERRPENAGEVFLSVARAFNEGSGGASGALFGAFFIALGERLRVSDSDDLTDFADGLELGLLRVREIGLAKPGDKTMLDALEPAVEAARSTVDQGAGAGAVLDAAATAARRGADATAEMRARAGRAKYAATGAVGSRDPGAVTLAVMFRAWADAVRREENLGLGGVGRIEGRVELAPTGSGGSPRSGDGRLSATNRSDGARGVESLATTSGHFAILALDHVRSFATTIRPHDPDSITLDEIRAIKQHLIEGLAGRASAVLVDPGMAPGPSREVFANTSRGLIIGIEDADYDAAAVEPRLLAGWTAERAARAGADAVKISVYFDPEDDTSAAERFVTEVVRQCDLVHIPLLCEPLARIRDRGETRWKVLEGVRRFGGLGAAVLKIQFPHDTQGTQSREAWADACHEADALSAAPWALLSEGRDFQEFSELLTIACRAGASGFVAGRVIWGSVGTAGDGVAVSAKRLDELRSIAISEGSPWDQRRSAAARSDSREAE